MSWCSAAAATPGCPIVITMSGGYAHDVSAIVTIHANTIRAVRRSPQAPGTWHMQRFRLLTEDHVKSLLPMAELITAMEAAVARFSAGEVLQPVRTVLMVGPTRALLRPDAGVHRTAGAARRQARHRLQREPPARVCPRISPPSCCSILRPERSSR